MGLTPNKTYTAPDGSVYRIEDDGSLTKIKDGITQTNQPPCKYQITPEGKIFRIESDGSITYLGYAEETRSSQQSDSNISHKSAKKNHTRVWIIIAILVAVVSGVLYFGVFYSTFIESFLQTEYSSSEVDTEPCVDSGEPYADSGEPYADSGVIFYGE